MYEHRLSYSINLVPVLRLYVSHDPKTLTPLWLPYRYPVVLQWPREVNLDIAMMSTASGQDFYAHSVRGLLQAMSVQFTKAHQDLLAIQPLVSPHTMSLFSDILDSTYITAKRASFVFGVYDSLWKTQPVDWRRSRLSDSRGNLSVALTIVSSREKHYKVPLERIAGWGRNTNPTWYV